MRSFKVDLFSKNYFRKFIGFTALVLINALFISKPTDAWSTLTALGLNSLMVYLILEFSSFAGDAYVSLDFRTDKEKKEDNINRKHEALEGAIENLIFQASLGEISKNTLQNRLDSLQEIKVFLDTNYSNNLLEAPKQQEDNSFLEMPSKAQPEVIEDEIDISILNQPYERTR
jgi:hypothetical protein